MNLFSFSQISFDQVAPTMPKKVNNQLPLAAPKRINPIESTLPLETSANRTEVLQRVRCGEAFQNSNVVNKLHILASKFQVSHETAANDRNALNKDDGVGAPEPPGEQVQHSHRADDSSEEKTEENYHRYPDTSSHGAEKKEAKEEASNEERDERASSDSISSSEDGGAYSNGRLEDATIEEEFPGFLTMLQLPGFPGTRTAPEPDFPLEVIPHIFVASHASHASDEVPTGPNEAMGSYECHCSCHQDFCHLCMCSKKRSKSSYVEHLYKGFIIRKCFS